MASDATNEGEFLVLSDQTGNYFAIPRETVERYRLSEEERAELEKELDDEVLGYVMDNWFVRENLTAQYQAERRQEAARERMIRAARGGEEGAEAPSEEAQGAASTQPAGLRGAIIGMFAMLRSLAPGTQR